MNRIFLYGNSLIVSKIVYNINYLTNLSCCEIVLLSDIKRHYYSIDNVHISFYDTPLECIENSDLILIFKDGNTPSWVIKNVLEYAQKNNKQTYFVEQDDLNYTNWNWFNNPNLMDMCLYRPVILCVSFGIADTSLACELMIERIFEKNHVKTYHIFSDKNMALINALDEKRILNLGIKDSLCAKNDSQVVIIGIDSIEGTALLKKIFATKSAISPDYILFQTDYSYENQEELQNIAKYICDRELDSWIKTRYISIEDKKIASYQIFPPSTKKCYDIENTNTLDLIEFDILSKISYPKGMKKFQ